MTPRSDLDRTSQLALVCLAVAQALSLWMLHVALAQDAWPATDIRWMYALYTVALGLPLFLYLGAARWHDRANSAATGIVTTALLWLGWHAAWVDGGGDARAVAGDAQIIGPLLVSVGVAIFIAAFVFRGWREQPGQALRYAHLLHLSWVNALTLALLALFVVVFWLMLLLCAQLFNVIGVSFFASLFSRKEFAYPVTGLVVGFGLVLIRNRLRLVATARGMCEALLRALLPLAALILVMFLAVLPFTGIEPLWQTGRGSALLALLTIMLLFFFNGALGSAPDHGDYARPLRWLLTAAMLLLPVIVALAFWGLNQRVTQHGWSVSRLWALFVVVMLGCYAVAYAASILRHRGMRYEALARWNTVLAVVLASLLVLVNTPVLDFRHLAALDQVARLERGDVSPEAFDAMYLRFGLGSYGVAALESLRQTELAAEDSVLADRIDAALAIDRSRGWVDIPQDAMALIGEIDVRDGSEPAPDEMLLLLASDPSVRENCRHPEARCEVGVLDVNGIQRWLFVARSGATHWLQYTAVLERSRDGRWLRAGSLGAPQCPNDWQGRSPERAYEIIAEPVPYVRIGSCAYQLNLLLEPQPLDAGTSF